MTYTMPGLAASNPIKTISCTCKNCTCLDCTTDPSDPNYGKYNVTIKAYEAD